jgi:hypothetical protein
MTTSNYFNNFNSRPEQLLYEDLIGEVVKIYGIDSHYIPRASGSTVDLLFGDDPTKKFNEAYPIEVYINNVDTFEGSEFYSKFGLEVRKTVDFIMPYRAFKKVVPSKEYSRPREGDLIWLRNFKALFEIKYVEEENFFYTFGKNNYYGFKLMCEKFRYSDEDLDTGWSQIDDVQNNKSFAYEYTMSANGSSTYQINEIVYQGNTYSNATSTAEVASWDKPTLKLKLRNVSGEFTTTEPIIGLTSNAVYTLASYDDLDNVNDLLDNNLLIDNEADGFLDFSETNPFGEP